MDLLIATNNLHKLQEIRTALAKTRIQVFSLGDVGISFDVEETGSTLQENALLKARAYSQAAQMLALGDDTGFEVTALEGKPGIHAKRWVAGTDHDRNMHLLSQLEGKTDRSAQFLTVLALAGPDERVAPLYFTGSVRGTIGMQERGETGFGYDPLFVPEGYAQSFAELGAEEKAKLSHRSRAVCAFVEYIQEKEQKEGNNVISSK